MDAGSLDAPSTPEAAASTSRLLWSARSSTASPVVVARRSALAHLHAERSFGATGADWLGDARSAGGAAEGVMPPYVVVAVGVVIEQSKPLLFDNSSSPSTFVLREFVLGRANCRPP